MSATDSPPPPSFDASWVGAQLAGGFPRRLAALVDARALDAAFDATPLCGAFSQQVAAWLWLGAEAAAGVLVAAADLPALRAELRARRTTAIVCASSSAASARVFAGDGVEYAAAELSDRSAAEISASVPAFCALVARALSLARAARARGDSVLVHCNSGMHRSSSVAAALLMAERGEAGAAGFARAFADIARARPVAQPIFWPMLESEAFAGWLLEVAQR